MNSMVEELSPELFLYELYDSGGIQSVDDAIRSGASFGYCDASRLYVRPRSGLFALMVEWPNGDKFWFHIDNEMLKCIKRRLARKNHNEDLPSRASCR